MTQTGSTYGRLAMLGAALLLAAPEVASARTATPTPTPRATVYPNPARSGQRVTLDASGTTSTQSPRWSQLAGDVALQIENAEMLVASFVAPAVSVETEVRVGFALLPLPPQREFTVTILPADAVAVTIGEAVGPPGGMVQVGVSFDPVGLAVRRLRHELTFPPGAVVHDRGDGVPDCGPGPGFGLTSADFEFLPAGCTATDTCTGVGADVVADPPIAQRELLYTCRTILTAEPADSCVHALRCAGGNADAADGSPLAVNCQDGAVVSRFQQYEPEFSLRVEPPAPAVGDTVHLTFSVSAAGGIPRFQVLGTYPFLEGDSVSESYTFGDVVFDLQAVRAGTTALQLTVNYETTGGCPGQEFFFFRSAQSQTFPLTITDPGGMRLAGRVAEFPLGCQGAMRGVTVRLEPGGRSTRTDLAAGEFAFDGVTRGDYQLTVQPGCNPFGCWPPRDVVVGSTDQFLTLCPRTINCPGDCDGDSRVTIDELITGVALALGDGAARSCPAIDVDNSSIVQIDELVGAVNAALTGCGGTPGVTPSPTPFLFTPTPTQTPTPTSCRAIVPVVAPVTSPTNALTQTIHLCGIGYATSSVDVIGPLGFVPINPEPVIDCPIQCVDGRQTCVSATVPLLMDQVNAISVCQVPGLGCGPLPDLCVEVAIEHRSSL